MRVIKPRVSALYLSAVAECKAAGVDISPEQYVWLYDAASRAVDGGNECPALLEFPVKVGNVTLYPRTIGASMWWMQYGSKWYGGAAGADEVVALAWMLSHSKDGFLFERLTSRWRTSAAILAWQVGLAMNVTVGELAWGIDRLFGQRDVVDLGDGNKSEIAAASSADWGGAVARLCATYHRPPEYFLWQIGETAALEMLVKAPMPDGARNEAVGFSKELAEFREIVRHIKASAKAAG